MKFFDRDWSCIFRWLKVWEGLSLGTRRYYLAASSHAATVSPEGYGSEQDLVLACGLVEPTSNRRLKPTAASVPFRALMAQLARFPLFDQKPTPQGIQEYLRKHYLTEEWTPIQSSWNEPAWDTLAWPQSFASLKNLKVWQKEYLTYFEREGQQAWGWHTLREVARSPKVTWFPNADTVEAAQSLARSAIEAVHPLPLLALPEILPERLRPFFEPALKACLRFLVLYPALRRESLDAVIGLCPTVVYHLNRPAAVPPPIQPCNDLVGVAFQLEDMTRVLVGATTGECRLNRSNGYHPHLFKVIEEKLREEFVPLPDWLQKQHQFGDRLSRAIACLTDLKLAKDESSDDKRLFVATAKGRKWLAQPPADRLRDLLFEFRRRADQMDRTDDCLSYLPDEVCFEDTKDGDFDHHAWLSSVWRQSPDEGCTPLKAFLDYHARLSNPLVNPAIPDSKRPRSASFADGWTDLRSENIEETCREVFDQFFWQRLVPLGCVETLARGDGQIWFRLSSAGKYLFGHTTELSYGQADAENAIVVQPNFEIVFLRPNLTAEVALAPLAERVGKHVGTLFRLSRPKAILAAAQGITAEAMLETLSKHSSKSVPANVAEEIRSWFSVCRSLNTRRCVLIEAGDRETALRVQHLLGPACTPLKDTLLECRGPGIDSKLRTKLTEQGLFLSAE